MSKRALSTLMHKHSPNGHSNNTWAHDFANVRSICEIQSKTQQAFEQRNCARQKYPMTSLPRFCYIHTSCNAFKTTIVKTCFKHANVQTFTKTGTPTTNGPVILQTLNQFVKSNPRRNGHSNNTHGPRIGMRRKKHHSTFLSRFAISITNHSSGHSIAHMPREIRIAKRFSQENPKCHTKSTGDNVGRKSPTTHPDPMEHSVRNNLPANASEHVDEFRRKIKARNTPPWWANVHRGNCARRPRG